MKAKAWGKAHGGRIFRRLVDAAEGRLECGHVTFFTNTKVQRCYECERERELKNKSKT